MAQFTRATTKQSKYLTSNVECNFRNFRLKHAKHDITKEHVIVKIFECDDVDVKKTLMREYKSMSNVQPHKNILSTIFFTNFFTQF